MKIPNCDQSFVPDQKITDYLLNDTHETGKGKAKFFKKFGFDAAHPDTFKDALIRHSVDRDIELEEHTDFGANINLLVKFRLQMKEIPA